MINLFKSKTDKEEVKVEYPKEVILLEPIPVLGDKVKLTLNEETFEYETYFKIPLTDEVGKVIEVVTKYSLPQCFFILKMVKFSTPEEIDKRSFIEAKKEALKSLIERIEHL